MKLDAAFKPERLGGRTTLAFGFEVTTTSGQVPAPLTNLDLRYPVDLGLATSGLGLSTCRPAKLRAHGPDGCPLDSRMGYGTALVEVPIGPAVIHETARITMLSGPIKDGHLQLLIHASGISPINAQIVFSTLLLPAPAPFGGRLDTGIPLVASLPGAPNVAVVQLRTTIGPLHLTYYHHVHGRSVPYHPGGIVLPKSCPHGGFPFAATFAFLDGTSASAQTAVPCPARR
ncbi:MAG TPA: hypothetical protein VLJ42_08900 [Solirubrobacteraceae bacterium]|nr:hypothetical protein [Solirubrobacteraceae bacterium]